MGVWGGGGGAGVELAGQPSATGWEGAARGPIVDFSVSALGTTKERRAITLNPGSGYLDISAFNPLVFTIVVTIFGHLRLQSLTCQSVG